LNNDSKTINIKHVVEREHMKDLALDGSIIL